MIKLSNLSRQLYKITFSFSNPVKYEEYQKKVRRFAETHTTIDITDKLPELPDRELHTTYAAVNPDTPEDEIKAAVYLALRGVIGIEYEEWSPFIESVEGLDTVFIEEERTPIEDKNTNTNI